MALDNSNALPAPGFISGAALWLRQSTVSVGVIHLPNPAFNTSYNLATDSAAPLPGAPMQPPSMPPPSPPSPPPFPPPPSPNPSPPNPPPAVRGAPPPPATFYCLYFSAGDYELAHSGAITKAQACLDTPGGLVTGTVYGGEQVSCGTCECCGVTGAPLPPAPPPPSPPPPSPSITFYCLYFSAGDYELAHSGAITKAQACLDTPGGLVTGTIYGGEPVSCGCECCGVTGVPLPPAPPPPSP